MKTEINLPTNIVINRVNSSKIALLITIIVLGVMMIITTKIAEFDNDSIIPPMITVATIVSLIASIVVAYSLKRAVYARTESPIKCVVIHFADSKSDEIAKAARGNCWSKIPELANDSNGVAMKLEILYSDDLSFAAYQFFSYVPHTYEPCSQIFYIDKEDIKRIKFAELKS